jgi:hypothetical protein
MTYPTIPLVQFYSNPVEYDTRAKRIEQGRGGVIDRSRTHFINAIRRTYKVTATLTDRDTLQTFLETNRGTPFEFRYDSINDPGLFICKTWTWTWIVYAEGNGVWNFTGNLEEVFRPGYKPRTTGNAALTLSKLTLEGAGVISQDNPIGSGTLTLSQISISGVGFTKLIGSGSLTNQAVITTGSGVVGLQIIGSGTLQTQTVTSTENNVASGSDNVVSGTDNVVTGGSRGTVN